MYVPVAVFAAISVVSHACATISRLYLTDVVEGQGDEVTVPDGSLLWFVRGFVFLDGARLGSCLRGGMERLSPTRDGHDVCLL